MKLSNEQKEKLKLSMKQYCKEKYVKRMKIACLISDHEIEESLDKESDLCFSLLLEKFDLSKCGPIEDFDEPGAKKPKTLEFYFKNYISAQISFIVSEALAAKTNRLF